MTTWELLKAPGTGIVLYIYAHVMLQALAYTAGTYRLPNTELTHTNHH
jgi:hypothetical protein